MKYVLPAAFLVLSFLAYARVLDGPFLSDDWCIAQSIPKTSLAEIWSRTGALYRGFAGFYRPLTASTFLLEESIGQTSPTRNHAVNIAIHGLNSYLVFLLSLRFLAFFYKDSSRFPISLMAGLIFLISPSHSETVSWIAARPDLLATFFCLLSLIFFFPLLSAGTRKGSSLSLLFLILALWSKESAIALPFLVTAITVGAWLNSDKKLSRMAIRHCQLMFVVLAIFWVLRSWLVGSLIGGYGSPWNYSSGLMMKSFVVQVLRSFLPPLPYELERLFRPAMYQLALGIGIAGALLLLFWLVQIFKRLRAGRTFVLLLLFLLSLVALIPAVNIGISLFSTDGERVVYLASVFSCILLSTVILGFARKRLLQILATITLVSLYVVSLHRSNENRRTAGILFNHVNNQIQTLNARGPLTIVNLPDNFRGVFVYRAYGCISPLYPNVEVLSFHSIRSLDEVIDVKRMEGDAYELSLFGEAKFVKINETAGCLQNIQSSPGRIKFQKKDCLPDTAIAYFQREGLEELSEARRSAGIAFTSTLMKR